ncbi:hypothetical protein BDF14DRAFT_200339 [Spinellus fusiger]|nr:hypothetical protein BDF14DRAFT_200339 [Spinellus fusiger]
MTTTGATTTAGNGAAVNQTVNEGGKENTQHPDLASQDVGLLFVREYYTFLNKKPHRLHAFYNSDSYFLRGDEGETVQAYHGQEEIRKKIEELNFEGCKVLVTQVDTQMSVSHGIIIQVLGEMGNKDGISQKFSQTFFLATQHKGYYVLNDIFRFLKDEVNIDYYTCDEEEEVQPADIPQAPAAVETNNDFIEQPRVEVVETLESVESNKTVTESTKSKIIEQSTLVLQTEDQDETNKGGQQQQQGSVERKMEEEEDKAPNTPLPTQNPSATEVPKKEESKPEAKEGERKKTEKTEKTGGKEAKKEKSKKIEPKQHNKTKTSSAPPKTWANLISYEVPKRWGSQTEGKENQGGQETGKGEQEVKTVPAEPKEPSPPPTSQTPPTQPLQDSQGQTKDTPTGKSIEREKKVS